MNVQLAHWAFQVFGFALWLSSYGLGESPVENSELRKEINQIKSLCEGAISHTHTYTLAHMHTCSHSHTERVLLVDHSE